jgi:hypothetical protein
MISTLHPTAGLRVDPFNALPVEQNQDIMFETNYYMSCFMLHDRVLADFRMQLSTYGHYRRLVTLMPCLGTVQTVQYAGQLRNKATCCSTQRSLSADQLGV